MPSNLVRRLESLKELPPMPNTLYRVIQEMDKVSSSAKTLEYIIKEDPVLATKILKIANSPYYGLVGQVNSIAHAIMILGFDEVRNLVLGLSLTQVFGEVKTVGSISVKDIWLHSMGVATASSWLSNYLGDDLSSDELFTMGLLHDIGRFILCNFFEQEFKEILLYQEKQECSLAHAEENFNLSHAEIGAYLAKRWGLGERVISVIRYHHSPKSAGEDELSCAAIYLADQLCHKLTIGWANKWMPKAVKLPRALPLEKEHVQIVARELKKKKEELEKSWLHAVGG